MTLHELIDQTTADVASDQPLELLASAAKHQQQLVERGDELLDHFVQNARSAGCSWSQIGTVLGVSKQAIQQRHSGRHGLLGWLKEALGGTFSKLLARFTHEARQAVILAQEQAHQLGHSYIGTEHLLLGVLAEKQSLGAQTLAYLGVDLEHVRTSIEEIRDRPATSSGRGHLPLTRRAKDVLERSLHESRGLEHNYIGTEHFLLGMINEGSGVAIDILVRHGVQPETLREALLRRLVPRG